MAFFYHDCFDFDDNIDDDWWDDCAYYQEEKDAYWACHYSKIYYNLPDSVSIFKANQGKDYYHPKQLSTDGNVTYQKIHSVINKIELLFSLWQKRLTHEWTGDVKIPWNKNNIAEAGKKNENIENVKEGEEEASDGNGKREVQRDKCPHLAMAVNALEQFEMLDELMSPIFSDGEDMFGYYDSDEWLSFDGDPDYSDEEEMAAFQWRMEERKKARRDLEKVKEKNECINRYKESARKFYAAFPEPRLVEETVNDLMTMKTWINNLSIFVLSRSLGRELPRLVMEKILQYLLNSHGEIQVKIGFLSKTQRFKDVEKERMQQLYASVLEVHSLFFEILFKNELVSNTVHLGEYIRKLLQMAMGKLSMLEEFNSWLLHGETTQDGIKGFTSSVFYCSHIKASGHDFDYLQPLSNAFTDFDGRHLAMLVPGTVKESCVRIYDAKTCTFIGLHCIARGDVALGLALKNNGLALMLKRNGCCLIEIRGLVNCSHQILAKLIIGETKKHIAKKLMFIEYEGSTKLLAQKDDDIFVIGVGMIDGSMTLSVHKSYLGLELLAAKGQYMIVREFLKDFATAKDVIKNSIKLRGVKVFDVESGTLLRMISDVDEPPKRHFFRWCATIDADPCSFNFILWNDVKAEMWKIEGGVVDKVRDIDLRSRLNSGTRLIFNKDIIAIQCAQSSHDSCYDRVDLTEVSFYQISTGKSYYHETYHSMYEKPETRISVAGGHIYGMHMSDSLMITLHSSTNGGEVRVCNFDLSHERIISLQMRHLLQKRKDEELKRQIKEAEKKRLNEERMKRKEEARIIRLNRKTKQRQAYHKKREQMDRLEKTIKNGTYVVGEVSQWRGTYGFIEIDGMGTAFIHVTDIQGRPYVTQGCRIYCQLREQIGHPRPKAVSACLIRC